MNPEQVKGKINQVVGKVQEKAGDVMDDTGQQLKGMARQVQGTAQDMYGRAYEHACDTADAIMQRVERNPWTSLAIVAGAGFLMGMMCRSHRR